MRLISTFFLSIMIFSVFPESINAQNSSENFEPTRKIWGYIFGDMFWKAEGDDALWGKGEYMNTEKNALGGNLRRVYLGYDHDMLFNLTTRILFETNGGTTDSQGRFSPVIKLGYLQWKVPTDFLHNQVLSVGLIPTPIFLFPEKAFGYRSVEKEALDARGIGRSTDQGISYSATFDEASNFGFTALVGHGTGNKPSETKQLEYTGSVFAKFLKSCLTVETMFNYKSLGDDREFSIFRVFLGYQTDRIRLGGEVARILNSVETTQGFNDVKPLLFSLFAAFNVPQISEKLEFFGRFDKFDPDTDFSTEKVYPDDLRFFSDQSLVILGMNYQPIEMVSLMPNIYLNIYDEKASVIPDRIMDIVLRTTIYYTF